VKALVIGYGSIGKRHAEILSDIGQIDQVELVTKQSAQNYTAYSELSEIPHGMLQKYDYFVIASITSMHYDQLSYLCQHMTNKKILVEKPLFEKEHLAIDIGSNQVCVGYNLRFHPVLLKLKELLSENKPLLANLVCGQYLPNWRPNTDYRESYSADINQGGGVLRDLSHELDYCAWLFGSFVEVKSINKKVSSLEISSDDIFSCVGITEHNVVVNISLDYLSRQPIRQLIIQCEKLTIFANLLDGQIQLIDDNKKEHFNFDVKKNDTYFQMHKHFINDSFQRLCTYSEGINIVKFIDKHSTNGEYV
jgi:predicted dehydrogenase